MTNSIRTPRQGTSATSRRIAEAVDNEDWQKFRLSLKGKPTEDKLALLECYMIDGSHYMHGYGEFNLEECVVCIRVDNYIKALCRGGQLSAGENIETVHAQGWPLRTRIIK